MYYITYPFYFSILDNYFIFNIDLSIIIIFQTRPSTILPWSMANPVSNTRSMLHLFHFILLSVIIILPPTTILLYFSDKVKSHFTTVVLLSCIILLFQFCHPHGVAHFAKLFRSFLATFYSAHSSQAAPAHGLLVGVVKILKVYLNFFI